MLKLHVVALLIVIEVILITYAYSNLETHSNPWKHVLQLLFQIDGTNFINYYLTSKHALTSKFAGPLYAICCEDNLYYQLQ